MCRQKKGERVSEIKLSAEWYRVNSGPYVLAFGDGTVSIAADKDVMRDHQALSYVNGVIRVPEDMRYKGEDGQTRHGDVAIAGILAWYASRQASFEYGYQPVVPGRGDDGFDGGDDEDEGVARTGGGRRWARDCAPGFKRPVSAASGSDGRGCPKSPDQASYGL